MKSDRYTTYSFSMTTAVLCAFLLGGCACAPKAAVHNAAAADRPWISLFNGKNLDGWTPKFTGYELGENVGNTFRVEDGVLKVAYDQYQTFERRFGHLFYHTPFSHYKLRLQYRFLGKQTPGGPEWAFRNSGAMLHCQDPATMRKDQEFPVCIEAQFLGGDGTHPRPTLNLCTPGTHVVIKGQLEKTHCINSSSATFHGDQWVTAEMEVHGGEVMRFFANGQKVLEFEQTQLDESDPDAQRLLAAGSPVPLAGGYIALQAESHPCEFRRIELLPLD